jgi:class 3 adenylate cyclase/tetratricopeptide (TPR) repeat protein
VLFADLVDSTALSQRVDPEDLREIQNQLRNVCSQAAAQHDAYVAQYQGDGVVFYFGYPHAQENDPERAVRCGLDIARMVATLRDLPAHEPMAVRVGIHTSHVALGPSSPADDKQWTAYGDATSIAARLQVHAEPGGVVVSDVTWVLVQTLFVSRCLGTLRLKGVVNPVVAWCVEREATGSAEHSGSGRVLSPFTGRDRERVILDNAWQLAARGDTQFIQLRGEPGMGKSRLARLYRDRAETSGARLLLARATANNSNQPFHPIVVLLEQTLGLGQATSDADREVHLEEALERLGIDRDETVPFLAPLLGISSDRYPVPDLSPARRRHRSLEVIDEILTALARDGPTLLVFEDLHWADASTAESLDHVVAGVRGVPLLALFTARPEFDPTWGRGTRLQVLDLEKLTQEQSELIARAGAHGKALPGEVLRQILARSDGVPLYVEELTRSVLESGVLHERSASWEVVRPLSKDLIPVGVHASLAARIDRLGPARATAQLAATIGREFSLALLCAVSDYDESTLLKDLQRLEDAGLAWKSGESGPDTFVFKHALVRDAAYESLLRSTRQLYHGRIATALRDASKELAGGRNDLIASHLTSAGRHEEAGSFWEAAGHDSLRRTANLEAAGHFRRAIECLTKLPATPEGKRRELELQNFIAPVLMSVYGWASTEVEEACQRGRALAEELGQPDRLYAPLWGLWSVYFLRGELSPALPAAEAVQQMADQAAVPLLQVTGRHATSYTRLFRGELQQALEEADAGLALFGFEQEKALAAAFQLSSSVCLRQSKAQALWMTGRLTEADQEAAGMLQLARALDHRPSLAGALAFALHAGGIRSSYIREMVRLHDLAHELSHLSQHEGFFMWFAVAQVYRGLIAAELKEDGARTLMMEGLELFAQTRTRVTMVMMNVLVAEALFHAGQEDEALGLLEQAEHEMTQREERFYAPEISRVRGRVFARRDEAARAESCYEQALGFAAAQQAWSLELRASLDLCELLAPTGRAELGRNRVAAAFGRARWSLEYPEPLRAHQILQGSFHHAPSSERSL